MTTAIDKVIRIRQFLLYQNHVKLNENVNRSIQFLLANRDRWVNDDQAQLLNDAIYAFSEFYNTSEVCVKLIIEKALTFGYKDFVLDPDWRKNRILD